MDFLNELNDRQREAAETMDGPLLIVAGAGSGKTRALTYRVANIIATGRAKPWQILAVTFTNKAANEMKKRIETLVGMDAPTVGTFHSICVRILRRHFDKLGRAKDFVIYDDTDSQGLMRRIFTDSKIDDDRLKPQIALGMIGKAKNVMKGADQYAAEARNYFERRVAELYKAYQERLLKNNAIDFDDILNETVRLLVQCPAVLEEYQERWRYLNVDEYQDTNHVQYKLIGLLAQKYRHLCVIGDSDQSIYKFRGADIRNILEFERDYPEAKVIKLEQNYRSTQPILDAADAVIDQNKHRKKKKMWTEKKEGDPIAVWHADSEREEAEWIAEEIGRLQKEGVNSHSRLQGGAISLNDIVVLYRTNAQSRILEECLLRYGLPYRVVGGVKFYARKEIKDLLAYLRLIHNPYDAESLLRIVNVPSRRIGDTTLNNLQAFALSRSMHVWEVFPHMAMVSEVGDAAKAALTRFYDLTLKWQQLAKTTQVSKLIRVVVQDIGYEAYLKDGTEEGEMRYENILELISVAQKYDGVEPALALATFLEEVALVSDVDKLTELQDQAVTLMTLHSVKGLEFPYVFIAGCEENVFPHSRSIRNDEDLEEERRLMYVGCTRAMKKLYLVAARRRALFGDFQANPMSRFVHDIPGHLVEWRGGIRRDVINHVSTMPTPRHQITDISYDQRPKSHSFKDGDRVVHQSFGPGMVVGTIGDVIAIAFEDEAVGIKKFAASIAPLTKIA